MKLLIKACIVQGTETQNANEYRKSQSYAPIFLIFGVKFFILNDGSTLKRKSYSEEDNVIKT